MLVKKIIEHMNSMPYSDTAGRVYRYGEFFPIYLSPFAYNETYAYEEFPLSKERALRAGYAWHEAEEKRYATTIESNELPDDISDCTDTVLEHVISCANKGMVETKCTHGYKIIREELGYYRQMNIPLPRLCPNCRYFERRAWLHPWKLWNRRCMHVGCTNTFETTYAPDRPEIVYCEACYQKEVC
jgi:hypothetical protein